MGESRIGFFSSIYYSIAGFSKYRYFLRNSTGRAIVYLLIISLVIGVITLVPEVNLFNKTIDELVTNIDTTIPDFTFADGKLEVKATMPIIIDNGGTAIVIDTSPDAEKILDSYDMIILITSDKIIQKNYVDKSVTNLSNFQGLVMTRDSIRQVLPVMKPIGIAVFLFLGIFFICGKFISALIVSIIGLIINSVKNTRLSYHNIFKISVYSLTLPFLLSTVLDLVPVNIPFKPLLVYVIASVYVYGAINTIKKELDNTSTEFI
ncbi:MAG: DUF1189 domain-containing protein [Clostridiaceae bacterium]